jgi:rhodanese-related sulfurtransferase
MLLLLFGLLLSASLIFAQQIKHSAYRAMLRNLLSHTVPEVSVAQAQADSAAIFLDAREAREYEVSHLEAADWVGYDHFSVDSVLHRWPKNQRIIVYCSVGYRSEKVAEQLVAAGYTDVANLYGGIFEWVNQSHPVVDSAGPTERVHAFDRTWGVWLRRGKKVFK